MNWKPQDFFLQAYDLFGIITPGILGMFFVAYFWFRYPAETHPAAIGELQWGSVEQWVILGAAIYVLGHLISVFGSLMEDTLLFGPHKAGDFIKKLVDSNPAKRDRALQSARRVFGENQVSDRSLRRDCIMYQRLNADDDVKGKMEQDRAHRALFRNLFVLMLGVIPHLWITWDPTLSPIPIFVQVAIILVGVLSFVRYIYLSRRYTNDIFDIFVAANVTAAETD